MYACMYVWMWTEFWLKYVHNLGCFAARFMWSYSLGNLALRTSAAGIWNLGNIIYTHTHEWNMLMYIVYIHILEYINISLQKNTLYRKKNMYVWMYVWIYGLNDHKQTEFWMKYVHNLGCIAARFMWSYSLGNLTHPGYFNPFWKYGLGTG